MDDISSDPEQSIQGRLKCIDIVHGHLQDGNDFGSLLVFNLQLSVLGNEYIAHDEGIVVASSFDKEDGNSLPEVVRVTPEVSLVPEIPGEWTTVRLSARSESNVERGSRASWSVKLYHPRHREDQVYSLQLAVLLRRYDTYKFQCRVFVSIPSSWGHRFWRTSFIVDPSMTSSNNLRKYDIDNLDSIDIRELSMADFKKPTSASQIVDSPGPVESESGQTEHHFDKGQRIRDLPAPATMPEGKTLYSSFQTPATQIKEEIPHVLVVNGSNSPIWVVSSREQVLGEDGTIKRDNLGMYHTVVFGPATRKWLQTDTTDCETSSALIPLWLAENEEGVVTVFFDAKYNEDPVNITLTERVRSGDQVYIDSTFQAHVKTDTETAPRDSPLYPIKINGHMFSSQHNPTLKMQDQSRYILIQTFMPLSFEQKEEFRTLNLDLCLYLSKNTYLYHRDETDIDKIRKMPHVAYANTYHQEFKIWAGLEAETASAQTKQETDIDIITHEDVDPKILRDKITDTAHVNADKVSFLRQTIRLTVQNQYLSDLASLDEVRLITKTKQPVVSSNTARSILQIGNFIQHNPGQQHFDGSGETVAVADTGFDTGHIFYIHDAFRPRSIEIQALGSAADITGHGTHVCGLIAGNGTLRRRDQSGNITIERIQGTATGASLLVQCAGPELEGLDKIDLYDLFDLAYSQGARIHNNSWNSNFQGQLEYGKAEDIDKFVSRHEDMIICFSAGNDGELPCDNQISNEACAKNCITVGSTMNYVNRSFRVDLSSSRGPTSDGRIKPDVVAPGVRVLSAKSRMLECSPDQIGHNWWHLTGTSMAAPLVAGCAAMLRQAVRRTWPVEHPNPSAALIKAILINGASDLLQSSREESGFGCVNYANSLSIALKRGISGFICATMTDNAPQDFFVQSITVPSGHTLRTTLVWSDPPGESLQNKLYLEVRQVTGDRKILGNIPRDRPYDPHGFDHQNNVQQVKEWNYYEDDRVFEIIVGKGCFLKGKQPFACVWSSCKER